MTISRVRGRVGFTLMEMTVIIFILLLIAASIVPSVTAFIRSEQLKALESKIIRLPDQARSDAVKDQNPVRLRFNGSSLIEEEVPLNGPVEQLNELDLGSSIQVDNTQKNYMTVDSSSWDWTAYPDGTSDLGGVQFTVESEQRSLIIPVTGSPTWASGALPDESQDQWTAGQLQQRSS